MMRKSALNTESKNNDLKRKRVTNKFDGEPTSSMAAFEELKEPLKISEEIEFEDQPTKEQAVLKPSIPIV